MQAPETHQDLRFLRIFGVTLGPKHAKREELDVEGPARRAPQMHKDEEEIDGEIGLLILHVGVSAANCGYRQAASRRRSWSPIFDRQR